MTQTLSTPSPARNAIAPFRPLPWQVAPWRDQSRIVLLTGSAGGGKSRLAAEKLHAYCLKYPGAFALVVRKVRVSLTRGTILFLRESVIGNDSFVTHHESKDYFTYANGSILAYIGLEDAAQRERLKSIGQHGGVDIVWAEEATELEEADHNALLARLRGKAAPWRQIIYTCNPDAPAHWIKRRLIDNAEASVYYSGEADNPYNPPDYRAALALMTGVEELRLRRGLWVQAQGAVFAGEWLDGPDGGNVTEAAEYLPDGGPIYWALDDGYSAGSSPATRGLDRAGYYVADAHPRVILWCQLRATGQLAVFDEDYRCQTLSDEHIAAALDRPYPRPEAVVHGPGAAEIRARIYAADLLPVQSTANVLESIKELRRHLAADRNGVRRILVHPRCRQLRYELASYAYEPGAERPAKRFDHGVDALRGLIWTLRGDLQ